MRPRRTESSHRPISLPGGTEDNDLWVRDYQDGGGASVMASIWEPSGAERAQLATGANLELLVWALRHPPVAIRTTLERPTANPQRLAPDTPTIWIELTADLGADVLAAINEYAARRHASSDRIERLELLRGVLERNLAELARQAAAAESENPE